MAAKSELQPTADRVLRITRIFDAPRALVFKMWTDPEHLKRWLAPIGFSVLDAQGQLRADGPWRSGMKAPDGAEHWVSGAYREIVQNQRLVFTHRWDGADGKPGHETIVTVEFADEGGRTRMTFEQAVFKSAESRNGHAGGWASSFARLSEYLRGQPSHPAPPPDSPRREVVLTRVFDAPRDLVFRAWTDPKLMAQWWGPAGFTNPVCEMDVRPGGAIHILMRDADGADHPMTGTFREVVPPQRLVFEGIPRDNLGVAYAETLTTVTFDDEGGKTRITITTRGVGLDPSVPDVLAGMDQGWAQSLDRLAELLSRPDL